MEWLQPSATAVSWGKEIFWSCLELVFKVPEEHAIQCKVQTHWWQGSRRCLGGKDRGREKPLLDPNLSPACHVHLMDHLSLLQGNYWIEYACPLKQNSILMWRTLTLKLIHILIFLYLYIPKNICHNTLNLNFSLYVFSTSHHADVPCVFLYPRG